MRYIQELREGSSVNDIYLCRKKQSMTTKNGKNYDSLMLQTNWTIFMSWET